MNLFIQCNELKPTGKTLKKSSLLEWSSSQVPRNKKFWISEVRKEEISHSLSEETWVLLGGLVEGFEKIHARQYESFSRVTMLNSSHGRLPSRYRNDVINLRAIYRVSESVLRRKKIEIQNPVACKFHNKFLYILI